MSFYYRTFYQLEKAILNKEIDLHIANFCGNRVSVIYKLKNGSHIKINRKLTRKRFETFCKKCGVIDDSRESNKNKSIS